jgi:hypothetical protein
MPIGMQCLLLVFMEIIERVNILAGLEVTLDFLLN